MANKKAEPTSTIKITEEIRDVPVDPDELEDQQLTPRRRGRPTKKITSPASYDDEDDFPKMLQDHTVKIHVDRVSPREWRGKQISGMIEEYVPPITIEEIETDTRQKCGGGRYRVRVMKNGRFVGARGFHVYGDPKFPDEEMEPDEFRGELPPLPPGVMEFGPAGMGTPPVLDTEITDLRKQIEKEKLRNALDEVKGVTRGQRPEVDADEIRRETEERIREKMDHQRDLDGIKHEMDRRFTELINVVHDSNKRDPEDNHEKDIQILELQNKIEKVQTETASNLTAFQSEMKSLFSEMKNTKPDTTPELLSAVIGGFASMSQSKEGQFQAMVDAERVKSEAVMNSMSQINDANARVQQANNEKLMITLQNMQGGNDIGGMAKTVGAVRDMAEMMGMTPGGGGEAEPQDMMTRILGLVEKALPSLLAAQKAKDQQGQQQGLSQAEVQAIIQQQAQIEAQRVVQAHREAEGVHQQQIPQNVPQQAPVQYGVRPDQVGRVVQGPTGPVVVPPHTVPPTPPQPAPPQTQQAAPPAPPVAPPETPPQQAEPVVQPQPITPDTPSQDQVGGDPTPGSPPPVSPVIPPPTNGNAIDPVEQEKVARVNDCFQRLLYELQIRPRTPSWNDYAFENLPADVLEKFVLAIDAEGVLDAIDDYADPQLIESFKTLMDGNQRAIDWFVDGINEMKIWYSEKDETEPQVVQQVAPTQEPEVETT